MLARSSAILKWWLAILPLSSSSNLEEELDPLARGFCHGADPVFLVECDDAMSSRFKIGVVKVGRKVGIDNRGAQVFWVVPSFSVSLRKMISKGPMRIWSPLLRTAGSLIRRWLSQVPLTVSKSIRRNSRSDKRTMVACQREIFL